MSSRTNVLFICEHNAGRSQLGAHLLAYAAPGGFDADSAGLRPSDEINPIVAESLRELGIDTSAARPRRVTAQDLAAADVVVTMKPGLALPGPVAGRLVEWEFPNPENWDIDGVRLLRDRVLREVRQLVEHVGEGPKTDLPRRPDLDQATG